jgi:hypothetical protein
MISWSSANKITLVLKPSFTYVVFRIVSDVLPLCSPELTTLTTVLSTLLLEELSVVTSRKLVQAGDYMLNVVYRYIVYVYD